VAENSSKAIFCLVDLVAISNAFNVGLTDRGIRPEKIRIDEGA
jgi:hypothetical protein